MLPWGKCSPLMSCGSDISSVDVRRLSLGVDGFIGFNPELKHDSTYTHSTSIRYIYSTRRKICIHPPMKPGDGTKNSPDHQRLLCSACRTSRGYASKVPYMVVPGNHEAECHSPQCLFSKRKLKVSKAGTCAGTEDTDPLIGTPTNAHNHIFSMF